MNTRRFILRLIVGLLTFCLGVTLAVLIGHVNPRPNVQFRSLNRDWTPPPTVYAPEPRSTCSHPSMRTAELKSKPYTATTPEAAESDELPPPPPPAPVKPAQPATSHSTR